MRILSVFNVNKALVSTTSVAVFLAASGLVGCNQSGQSTDTNTDSTTGSEVVASTDDANEHLAEHATEDVITVDPTEEMSEETQTGEPTADTMTGTGSVEEQVISDNPDQAF